MIDKKGQVKEEIESDLRVKVKFAWIVHCQSLIAKALLSRLYSQSFIPKALFPKLHFSASFSKFYSQSFIAKRFSFRAIARGSS